MTLGENYYFEPSVALSRPPTHICDTGTSHRWEEPSRTPQGKESSRILRTTVVVLLYIPGIYLIAGGFPAWGTCSSRGHARA